MHAKYCVSEYISLALHERAKLGLLSASVMDRTCTAANNTMHSLTTNPYVDAPGALPQLDKGCMSIQQCDLHNCKAGAEM